MITIENISHQHKSVIGTRDRNVTIRPDMNMSNLNQTKPLILPTNDEGKIIALEKNISFLREQHELMLTGLHEEIETLRRTNKESCSIVKEDKELSDLKRLLDEERNKNDLLLQQLASLHLARTVVSDHHSTAGQSPVVPKLPRESRTGTPDVKQRTGTPDVKQRTGTPDAKQRTSERHSAKRVHGERTSHGTRHSATGNKETLEDKAIHPDQLQIDIGKRILSPELNPESSSSAILLTPRTSIAAPDGFWVRPSITNLQNKLVQPNFSTGSHKFDGLQSDPHHVLPVKLPILRTSGSLNQALVNDMTKEMIIPKLIPNSNEMKTDTHANARMSLESAQAKASRSARGSLGHNSIAIYDPMHDFPPTASSTDIHNASRSYAHNLGPFLPALSKSGDAGHVARTRKTRELQRKRLDRAQNLFPS